jgi:hypothetical protein
MKEEEEKEEIDPSATLVFHIVLINQFVFIFTKLYLFTVQT